MIGGEPTLTWTSFAPAFLTSCTIFLMVVPRTMESSTRTILLAFMTLLSGLSLSMTLVVLSDCSGMMNVRSTYLFFMSPSEYRMPEPSAYPIAWDLPESGIGTTTSASTGCSLASLCPILRLTSYTSLPSMFESALARETHSNMQWAQPLESPVLTDFISPGSSSTISPGSTSLTNSPPSVSNTPLSDAAPYPPLVLPTQSGLIDRKS